MIQFIFSVRARVIGFITGIVFFTNFGASLLSLTMGITGPKEVFWVGFWSILINGIALIVKKIPYCSRIYNVLAILSILLLAFSAFLIGFLLLVVL